LNRGPGRKKAAILVANTIVREIRRLDLGPGDKLISEDKAVARYGVARGTLREALRFLELQGVLRMRSGPGGGPIVARPGSEHLASTLSLLLQFVGAPFRDILQTRSVIEPGMSALAARNASEGDIEALRACLEAVARGIEDDEIYYAENRRFHDLVATASGNLVFASLIPALHWISDGSGLVHPLAQRRSSLRAKWRVLRAVQAGDGDEASREMLRLLERSVGAFERNQPEILKTPVSWVQPGN